MLKRRNTISRWVAGTLLACLSQAALAQVQTGSYALMPPETTDRTEQSPLLSLFGLSDDQGQLATVPVRALSNASVVVGLNADSGNPTLPWCAESSGLLRIGRLGSDCLMSGRLELELPGQVNSLNTGLAWQGDRIDFGLNYGWSWQVSPNDTVAPVMAPLRTEFHPSMPLLGNQLDSKTLGAAAQWRLTSRSAVQLNAALSQLKLWSGSARPVWDLDQAALGMGLRYGPFGGNVRGRVGRVQDPLRAGTASFGGLDIGVSWRTPWAGELTVGADNLVLKRDDRAETVRAIDEATARTPYVIYKQDL